VLGTLITEWEGGEAACKALFANEVAAGHAAAQLARIADAYGFDGWLVNIENALPVDLVPNVLHFLRCARRGRMRPMHRNNLMLLHCSPRLQLWMAS
jgi:endo-beta-N-acetylglucosaminidase D